MKHNIIIISLTERCTYDDNLGCIVYGLSVMYTSTIIINIKVHNKRHNELLLMNIIDNIVINAHIMHRCIM